MFHNSGKPTLVFISAELSTLSPEANAHHTESLRRDLENEGLNWDRALGCYKGTLEQSNMIVLRDPAELDLLMNFMQFYGQESILVRNSDNTVELHYSNGKIEQLKGTLQEVSESDTQGLDAWTKVNHRYFTVK